MFSLLCHLKAGFDVLCTHSLESQVEIGIHEPDVNPDVQFLPFPEGLFTSHFLLFLPGEL